MPTLRWIFNASKLRINHIEAFNKAAGMYGLILGVLCLYFHFLVGTNRLLALLILWFGDFEGLRVRV